MPVSRWIIAVALGITLLLGQIGHSQEGPEDEAGNTGGDADASNNEAFPLGVPVGTVEQPEQPRRAQTGEYEADKREVEDLIAQQSMADSTEQIVFWTKLQFVLAALGTAALVYSLHLNRRSTSAAVDAVSMERAWMMYGGSEVGTAENSLIGETPVANGLMIIAKMLNKGRSPAKHVEMKMQHKFISHSDEVPKF